jgi:hypothetical protein
VKKRFIGREATQEEKRADFDFLANHGGLGQFDAANLAKYTTLELQPQTIDELFTQDVEDATKIARHEFGSALDSFPLPCRATLIDIAFNCGGFSSFRLHFVPIFGKGSLRETQ